MPAAPRLLLHLSMQRLTDEILHGLQHAAYQLLFAVDGLAKRDPTWLSSAALERIKTPRTCAAWLREKRGALPPELFPPPELERELNGMVNCPPQRSSGGAGRRGLTV